MPREAQREALYRRWRPQTFDEIVGQEHVARTLANAVKSGRVAHAYLLCGPRGTGKTSTARILAKSINCEKGPTPAPCGVCRSCVEIAEGASLDVIEVDAASYRQVDETQEVLKGVHLAPSGDRRKIYIIDEVHMLSTHSFNALLKTLEEPPEHVIFVLATTEPHRVLPTVLSRCQRFDFHRVPVGLLINHLRRVAGSEKIDVADDALSLVARRAQGSVRDALGALEQLSEFTGEARVEATDATRLLGAVELDVLIKLIDQLHEGRAAEALLLVQQLTEEGRDARSFIAEMLEHLRRLFLAQHGAVPSDLAGEELEKVRNQAERIDAGRAIVYLQAFGEAYERARGLDARLSLETTIVKLARPAMDASLDGLIQRLERLETALSKGELVVCDPLVRDGASRNKVSTPKTASVEPEASPDKGAGVPDKPAATMRAPELDNGELEPTKTAMSAKQDEHSPDPSFERLLDSWDAVLQWVRKKKPAAGACLVEAKPTAFEKGKLILEFGPKATFHRERIESEYAELVTEGIKAVSGLDVSVGFKNGSVVEEDGRVYEEKLSMKEVVGIVADAFDAKIVEESTGAEDFLIHEEE